MPGTGGPVDVLIENFALAAGKLGPGTEELKQTNPD